MQGLSAVFFFAYLCSAAAFTRIQPARAHRTRMFQAAEEQTVKDLDLDQMFEVFEQADKLPGGDKKMGGGGSPRSSGPFDPKSQPGVTGPLGFFDPVGLCPQDAAGFKKFRESELKHGRVAMLAFAGIVAGELFPVFFGSQITGPAIYQYQIAEDVLRGTLSSPSSFSAWSFNVVGLTLAIEGYNIVKGWEGAGQVEGVIAGLKPNYVNGDLGFDPLGFGGKTSKEMQTKEINNGRLAMLGVAGIVAQELVTGQSVF